MHNSGMLILAQADHLTGEEIGFAIDRITTEGANNVYFFSGITKKNRSGCVLLIDIDPETEPKYAHLLANQFSIYGYHRVLTSHHSSDLDVSRRSVVIQKDDESIETEVRIITTKNGSGAARIEHADLVSICEQTRQKLNTNLPLAWLRQHLQYQALSDMHGPLRITL